MRSAQFLTVTVSTEILCSQAQNVGRVILVCYISYSIVYTIVYLTLKMHDKIIS